MDVTRTGEFAVLRGRLRQIADTYGWALCIGAGTSVGVFGDWQKLATSVLRRIDCPPETITELAKNFSPEAMIQAAFNTLSNKKAKFPEQDFVSLLSDELYGPFKKACGPEWSVAAKALTTLNPTKLSHDNWKKFRDLVKRLGPPSASPLAEVVAGTVGGVHAPSSILSFNAEPLFFALIICFCETAPEWQLIRSRASRPLDRVIHDISQRHKASIPYFYVHGLLPVPDGKRVFNSGLSKDKLVFSEGQYLQLSKSTFTWQSAAFLSQCTQHRLIFFGVSFSDPNLRRWLAWDHAGRTSERLRQGYPIDRLQHYWIRRCPDENTEATRNMIQQSVAHLGVRIVWMNDWNEIGKTMKHLLAYD